MKIVTLINESKPLLKQFTGSSQNCLDLSATLKFSKKIGEGVAGDVYEVVDENDEVWVCKKIKDYESAKECLLEKKTGEQVCGGGVVDFPKGSYVCSSEGITEYVISALLADLKHQGKCALFLDVKGFTICPEGDENTTYYMMEKGDGDMESFISKVWTCGEYYTFIQSIIMMMFASLAVMNKVYKIQHNDIKRDNYVYKRIKPEDTFNGEKLDEADYFHIHIEDLDVYIPYVPFLVYPIDFGLACKYSKPIVYHHHNPNLDCSIPPFYLPQFDTYRLLSSFETSGVPVSSRISVKGIVNDEYGMLKPEYWESPLLIKEGTTPFGFLKKIATNGDLVKKPSQGNIVTIINVD